MKIRKVVPYLLVILTIPSISQWLSIGINNLTILWWGVYLFIIILFIASRKYYFKGQTLPWHIKFFLSLVVLEGIYGFILSEGYWDTKMLVQNVFTFLLPLSIYSFSSPALLGQSLNKWFRIALPGFFLFLPIMHPQAIGVYLIPILFLLLFIKFLSFEHKLITLLFFSFIFIFGSLGARSNIIKYSVALLFGVGMYIGIYRWNSLIRLIHLILMIIPFTLFTLAAVGSFNVFKFKEYSKTGITLEVKDANGSERTELLDSDTRTFIYEEAISSAINENYVIQGHSLARGYKSKTFGFQGFYGRGERYSSEVSIVNIFTYFGIFGVLTYFIIFLSATYKALYKSHNIYVKMLAIYLSFRWVYAWVEDFSRFDLNYLFLWITIAMCLSPHFRYMNNKEFEQWGRSLFSKYRVKRIP